MSDSLATNITNGMVPKYQYYNLGDSLVTVTNLSNFLTFKIASLRKQTTFSLSIQLLNQCIFGLDCHCLNQIPSQFPWLRPTKFNTFTRKKPSWNRILRRELTKSKSFYWPTSSRNVTQRLDIWRKELYWRLLVYQSAMAIFSPGIKYWTSVVL